MEFEWTAGDDLTGVEEDEQQPTARLHPFTGSIQEEGEKTDQKLRVTTHNN